MMAEPERLLVVRAFNAAASDAEYSCLHELFQERARAAPGAMCLSCAGAVLTYAEVLSPCAYSFPVPHTHNLCMDEARIMLAGRERHNAVPILSIPRR